jgi:hypothetical protein
MDSERKRGLLYFVVGLALPLIIWGVQLIGVVVNILLGSTVLAIAFGLVVYAFWIWERPSTWHVLLRIGTITIAAVIYFLFVGKQMIAEWHKEHPRVVAKLQSEPSMPPEKVPKEPSPTGTPTIKLIPPTKPQGHHSIVKSNPIPAQPPQNCPNGNCIGGDNNGTATVNNTFSDRYPRPGTIPKVNFCVFQSKPVAEHFETIITIKTDSEISAPFWSLFFDGPVTRATVAIDGIQEPFGSTNGHPFAPGAKLDPLGTLPVKSRILLNADADATIVNSDDILKIQITEIGPPFGGPYRAWGPRDHLTVTIQSKHSIQLLAIASGYGREFIEENMAIQCD